jgi:hypothetical protein
MELSSKLELIIPALLVLNIALSALSQVLVVLGKKEIPLISQISVTLKKILDFISANTAHK